MHACEEACEASHGTLVKIKVPRRNPYVHQKIHFHLQGWRKVEETGGFIKFNITVGSSKYLKHSCWGVLHACKVLVAMETVAFGDI